VAHIANPMLLLPSLALSLGVLARTAVVAACWLALVQRSAAASMAALAFAVHLTPSYVVVAPALVLMAHQPSGLSVTATSAVEAGGDTASAYASPAALQLRRWLRPASAAATVFLLAVAACLCACRGVSGSWAFVDAVYGWRWRVDDLTPNVGVAWYFFAEVVGDFRSYFQAVFALHPLMYVVPLTLRFYHRPALLFALLLAYGTLFTALLRNQLLRPALA
jgi:phosphatidylinositol glycan class U